jgi:hypothetical protein
VVGSQGLRSVDRHGAAGGRFEAGDLAQEHALAGAARAHDGENLAGRHGERDVEEHVLRAVAFRERDDLDLGRTAVLAHEARIGFLEFGEGGGHGASG